MEKCNLTLNLSGTESMAISEVVLNTGKIATNTKQGFQSNVWTYIDLSVHYYDGNSTITLLINGANSERVTEGGYVEPYKENAMAFGADLECSDESSVV